MMTALLIVLLIYSFFYHVLQSINNMLFMRNEHWDNMSDITASSEIVHMTKMNNTHIYQVYNFAYRPKIDLPILSMRSKIVSMIASNSVVIIRGSTGCGKTTQVPQFILDAEFQKKQHCNIIGISCLNLSFSEHQPTISL